MAMVTVATLVLIAGMVDDLRSRKVHNALVMALLFAVATSSLYWRGFDGTMVGVSAMLLALIITIPLFAARILGGGDVKLFAIFALAIEPHGMFWTLLYSIIWGALFGLVRATLNRQIVVLVRNTIRTTSRHRPQALELHQIPYTFAMLLGWLTQMTFMRIEGLL